MDATLHLARLQRAQARLADGRIDDALADYTAHLRHQPRDLAALAARSHCYWVRGDVTRALNDLTTALRLDPMLATYRITRALYLGSIERFDAALLDLEEACRIEPENARAHELRAGMLRRLKRLPEAIVAESEAIRLMPDAAAPRVRRAQMASDLGDVAMVIEDCRAALACAPEDVPAMNLLAWTLATMPGATDADRAEAIDRAEAALALAGGGDGVVLDTLAVACAANGRFEDAIAAAERAVSLLSGENQAECLARIEQFRQGQFIV
jgi:tetratricopeptide (TPR) repeat protein